MVMRSSSGRRQSCWGGGGLVFGGVWGIEGAVAAVAAAAVGRREMGRGQTYWEVC